MSTSGAAVVRAAGGPRSRPTRPAHPTRPTKAQRPPGPSGRPLVGNLADYEADRLGFLLRTRGEHGGIVSFDDRTTIVHDLPLVEQVLRCRTAQFEVRHNVLQQRLSMEGAAETSALSALLAPRMRRSLAAGIAERLTTPATTRLDALRADGSCFEPVPVFEELISTAVAGYYFGDQGAGLVARTTSLLDRLSQVIGNPLALPAAWPTPRRRRIAAEHRALRHDVAALLQQRLRHPGHFDDLAADVVAAADRRTYSLERIADLLIGSLLAAHRVPAAAVSWVFLLLADHPDVQERLRADTAGVGPRDRLQHPLALAVVLESLRLYPPTWLFTREASTAVELGGYHFPAGHHFMISPYVVHRDDSVFDRPEVFDPDRWTEAGRPPVTGRGLMPFGAGRHACPGSHLATTALVTLVRVALCDSRIQRTPGPVIPDPRTTLLPTGVRLRLTDLQAHPTPRSRQPLP